MKRTLLTFTSLLLAGSVTYADVVYVTARPQPSGAGANADGTYTEIAGVGADTSAAGTGTGVPARSGCRYFSNSFSNTTYAASSPNPAVRLTPTLGVAGGIYQIHHNFSSLAGNVSTNISMTVTCSAGGTLSFTTAGTNFIRAAGSPATQWKFLGYLTNDPGSTAPLIDLYYLDGHVSAGAQQRLLLDCFRFTLYEACLDIPVVGITGPLGTNANTVVVTGVSATATNINVYQNSGSGMVLIGSKSASITAGNNTVTVSGLTKGAIVGATQTINGQEGCIPTAGVTVGGGNPPVRIALTIREMTNTVATIGAAGAITGQTNLHFLGASTVSGGAPIDAPMVYPSNGWQTVTFDRGTIRLSDSANATGLAGLPEGAGNYGPNDTVAIRVYAYRTVPETSVMIFSSTPAESSLVTSNDAFIVNWTWNAVPGADGYRVLRNYNSDNYANSSVDITGTSFADANNSWGGLLPVTPSLTQTNPSIQWSPTVSNPNALPGRYGALESINFAIGDTTDTGPYDLYVDNLQNGSTVWQTFENSVGSAQGVSFQAPSFSGSTSANLLGAPNASTVSVRAADAGTKALRIRYQWNGTNSTKWLRLTTSGATPASNPYVDLDKPISFRLLLLPAGSPMPTQPAAPTLSIGYNQAGQTVLDWTGGHYLRAASDVSGTYTNTGVTLGPWTNTLPDPVKFFRLADPYDN